MPFRTKAIGQAYYKARKHRMVIYSMEYNKILRQKLRLYVLNYLKTHPCVDCGEGDIRVLDFDHVRGIKRTEVMRLAHGAYGWNAVKNEIAKCDIRCANCHRKKTYKEKNWLKDVL